MQARRKKCGAFSLLELLSVMLILVVVVALVTPRLHGLMGASNLSAGSEVVVGSMSLARQLAVSRNHDVEVRLIECKPDAGGAVATRAIQLVERTETGEMRPASRIRYFPSRITVWSKTAGSTLLALPLVAAVPTDPPIGSMGTSYSYRSLRFRPDGSTDLSLLLPTVSD